MPLIRMRPQKRKKTIEIARVHSTQAMAIADVALFPVSANASEDVEDILLDSSYVSLCSIRQC